MYNHILGWRQINAIALLFAFLLTVLAGCAGASGSFSDMPLESSYEDKILAFVNGEPVYRSQVLKQAVLWHEKKYLEEYVIWKLVQQKKQELHITSSLLELQERAERALQKMKKDYGETNFTDQLKSQKLDEDTLIQSWIKNGSMEATLANEKMVTYTRIISDSADIQAVFFALEKDAKNFLDLIGDHEDQFDSLLEKFKHVHQESVHSVRMNLVQGFAPRYISQQSEEKIFQMKPGYVSNPEVTTEGYMVVKLYSLAKGEKQSYDQARDFIKELIVQDPPSTKMINQWIENLRRRGDVKYEDRDSH